VLFEAPLEGAGKSVVEFYRDRNGELVSCIVRGDRVHIYKDAIFKGSFQIISDVEQLPET